MNKPPGVPTGLHTTAEVPAVSQTCRQLWAARLRNGTQEDRLGDGADGGTRSPVGELGAILERPGLWALHPLSLPGPWVPALTLSPPRPWCSVVIRGWGLRRPAPRGTQY